MAVVLFFALAFPSQTQAASVTFDFAYSGVNAFVPNATATGTGSFTVDYSNLGPQPPTALTGFSLLLTLTNSAQSESSTFAYNLSDIALNPSVILEGTAANPLPAQIAVITAAITGSDSIFGSVAVDLNMVPSGGSIVTQGFSHLGDSSGTSIWTSILTAPEPSTPALLLLGIVITLCVRFRARVYSLFVS